MTSEKEFRKTPHKAIIYARISSASQAAKGDGINSQITRCQEYARYKGYEIVETYKDKAISGGVAHRPGLDAALSFLTKQNDRSDYVMLFDDISRIARDLRLFLDLRDVADDMGFTLESPTMAFDGSSMSVMSGNIQAVFAEHQRLQNAEQTKNRMRARAINGYWPFPAPIGYRFERVQGHGNLLVRDEPLASIIQEALEGFASARFETQGEVKRFLESHPEFPKDFADGTIRYERVVRLLRRVHFAGYIEFPKWDVSLRKGHHEPLVSLETFEKVQTRMKEKARAPARKDISADFPLRGFVTCGCCGNPLTANWSKSKTGKKHPYYMCFTKGCDSYRKSIRRDVLEGEFDTMLQSLQPKEHLFACAKAMFKEAWSQRSEQAAFIAKTIKQDIAKIEKQMEALVDRLLEASTPTAIKAYEQRLSKLEREKAILEEKTQNKPSKPKGFDQLFELACQFLSNPWNIWANGDIHLKKMVMRMAFSERLAYCRKTGLRTPKTTLPFKVLADIDTGSCEMADRKGFEPSRRFLAYALSRGAPSTTRPPVHRRG